MGDLPGSPSVAPSPPFCTALRGGRRAEPRLSRLWAEAAWAGIWRLAHGVGSVVSTARGWDSDIPSWCLECDARSEAALRSAATGGHGTYVFLFLVRAKVIVPGARVAKPGGDMRSRGCLPLCVAPPRRRERNAGWIRSRSSTFNGPPTLPALPRGSTISIEEGEGA
jgi:hypothetical protein